MNFRRSLACVLMMAILACLAAAPALASETGDEDPVNTTTGFVFRVLNFLIVAYGVWYAFARRLPKFFRARAESIASAVSEAAQAKQEAQRQLRDAEKKLDHLDLEVNVLRENAQRDAAAESERIRTAAREDAAKVERAAELEIAAAERAARMELKAHAAQLAVERAEAMLRGKMTPDTDAALFRAFVSDLGRSAN
jgi:F-type H+-transporting ATPase subunit b